MNWLDERLPTVYQRDPRFDANIGLSGALRGPIEPGARPPLNPPCRSPPLPSIPSPCPSSLSVHRFDPPPPPLEEETAEEGGGMRSAGTTPKRFVVPPNGSPLTHALAGANIVRIKYQR